MGSFAQSGAENSGEDFDCVKLCQFGGTPLGSPNWQGSGQLNMTSQNPFAEDRELPGVGLAWECTHCHRQFKTEHFGKMHQNQTGTTACKDADLVQERVRAVSAAPPKGRPRAASFADKSPCTILDPPEELYDQRNDPNGCEDFPDNEVRWGILNSINQQTWKADNPEQNYPRLTKMAEVPICWITKMVPSFTKLFESE